MRSVGIIFFSQCTTEVTRSINILLIVQTIIKQRQGIVETWFRDHSQMFQQTSSKLFVIQMAGLGNPKQGSGSSGRGGIEQPFALLSMPSLMQIHTIERPRLPLNSEFYWNDTKKNSILQLCRRTMRLIIRITSILFSPIVQPKKVGKVTRSISNFYRLYKPSKSRAGIVDTRFQDHHHRRRRRML